MLQGTARLNPGAGVYIVDARGGQEFRDYAQLLDNALRAGAALQARGVSAGERVMLVQSTGFDFLSAFFGAQIIGAMPVPIVPPRAGSAQERRDKLRFGARPQPAFCRYARQLGVGAILADRGVDLSGASDLLQKGQLKFSATLDQLLSQTGAKAQPDSPSSSDPAAYIQLSAGTAGQMRAVELTQRNILSNMRAIGRALQVVPEDVGVSWVPPYNSMGLVGVICFGIYWGLDMVMIHPERFLQRPEEWLMAISRHRGTLSTAPNFGYHYALRRCQQSNLSGLDLSSWRVAMNGAEPVRAQQMDAFERRFSEYGLKRDLFLPVYGLAEATLAVTFGELGAPVKLDGINRRTLETQGHAAPLPHEGASSPPERLHLVSVGRPLQGVSLKIMDASQQPARQLGERRCGEVWVRGPNRLRDYVQLADARPRSAEDSRLEGEWLATGDLGYIADGQLYIIGRACDVIRTARGRTLFPDEIELYVDSVDGVRVGSSVAFALPAAEGEPAGEKNQPAQPANLLTIVYELQDGTAAEEVEQAVRALLRKHMSIDPHTLVALSQDSVPKTHSGKVRRSLTRTLYLQGRLDRRRRVEQSGLNVGGLQLVQRNALGAARQILGRLKRFLPGADSSE